MRKIVVSLLLAVSLSSYAEEILPKQQSMYNTLDVSRLFDDTTVLDISTLSDLVEKEAKISSCIEDYIKKESRSYARVVQNNLYDLMHNFDRIASKISGQRAPADNVSFGEKIEALANVQCEAYYTLGILK